MSIETAPVIPRLWPVRLELILRNWESFTDAERDRVAAYVVMTWQASTDRRWFVERHAPEPPTSSTFGFSWAICRARRRS